MKDQVEVGSKKAQRRKLELKGKEKRRKNIIVLFEQIKTTKCCTATDIDDDNYTRVFLQRKIKNIRFCFLIFFCCYKILSKIVIKNL